MYLQRLTTSQPNRLQEELKPDEGEGRTRLKDNLETRKLGPGARRVVTAALVGALVAVPGVAVAEQAAPALTGQTQAGTGSDAGGNDVELRPSAKKNVTVTDKEGKEVGAGYDTIAEAIAAASMSDTVTINKTTDENVNVNKGVVITCAEGAEYKGTMRVTADNTSVWKVNFSLDGTGAPGAYTNASLVIDGADGVKVGSCSFAFGGKLADVVHNAFGIIVDLGSRNDVISSNTFTMPAHVHGSYWVAVYVRGAQGDSQAYHLGILENTVDMTGGTGSGGNVFVRLTGNAPEGSYGIKDAMVVRNTVTAGSGAMQTSFGLIAQGVETLTFKENTITAGVAFTGGQQLGQNKANTDVAVGDNDLSGSTAGYDVFAGSLEDGITFDKPDKASSKRNTLTAAVPGAGGSETAYLSTEDAIAALPDGKGTVKLLMSVTNKQIVVPAGKDVTVDLNGKQAAGVGTAPFKAEGKLTVTDSSDGTPGSVFNTNTTGETFEVADGGSVQVRGGLFNKPLAEGLIAGGSANLSVGNRFQVVDAQTAEGKAVSKVTTTDKDDKVTTVWFETVEGAEDYAKAQGEGVTPERVSYVVTYDLNDGSDPVTRNVAVGSALELADPAPRDGYAFLGWYVGNDRVEAGYKPSGDMTVKALWQKLATPDPTPTPKPDPTFGVTLPSATEGGKVSSDRTSAKAGETVTLTVTPDEGHRTSKVRVTDEAGRKVKVSYEDGKYTFTMPEGKAAASVEFKANDARDFADNRADTWFRAAVEEMSAKGVMNGYGDGTYFGVGHQLTRGEFAALLHNWAQPGLADVDDENETRLADVADGQFYTSAANWAVANGIINGVSNPDGSRSFAPDQPVTLEQMCVIIGNLVDRDAASKADTSELAKYVDGAQVSPWAAHYVAWASKVGLFSGSVEQDGLHVRGGESIMRERVAGVLSNAFANGILK